jgi:hypothetical protein
MFWHWTILQKWGGKTIISVTDGSLRRVAVMTHSLMADPGMLVKIDHIGEIKSQNGPHAIPGGGQLAEQGDKWRP